MAEITEKEFDMLSLLDKPDEEIAEELGITVHTVRKYNRILFKKLKVKNRTACVLKAIGLGLVRIDCFDSFPVRI